MRFATSKLSADSTMRILLYRGEMCPSVILSFSFLGLKCSQEEKKKRNYLRPERLLLQQSEIIGLSYPSGIDTSI